jgi:hypothetical protein
MRRADAQSKAKEKGLFTEEKKSITHAIRHRRHRLEIYCAHSMQT